jgi:hypothetical protein
MLLVFYLKEVKENPLFFKKRKRLQKRPKKLRLRRIAFIKVDLPLYYLLALLLYYLLVLLIIIKVSLYKRIV